MDESAAWRLNHQQIKKIIRMMLPNCLKSWTLENKANLLYLQIWLYVWLGEPGGHGGLSSFMLRSDLDWAVKLLYYTQECLSLGAAHLFQRGKRLWHRFRINSGTYCPVLSIMWKIEFTNVFIYESDQHDLFTTDTTSTSFFSGR